ncbi:FAD:protein FMN transferase [Candidatus Xianfuyuplasma coldseepsis]|uniref:FAD:protein FMN transferase n=1 Tax=Candidatus Xianfuyuplasma coldseepsis TaxID=2782163 RepID=A0A7L7KQB6_9MOLU|nr:FAD:protein FMN transferase [Xianfuyuplasma coldseepsis]QMS84472.1 DUF5011 domain-containing protein [Xianfuyuplasma coldseepsis]
MKRIVTVVLTILVVATLSACKENDATIELIGEDVLSLEIGDEYVEKGFIAKDGFTDISEYVSVTDDIDNTVAGDYEVRYTLSYENQESSVTRTVYYRESGCTVIEDTTITECRVYWAQYLHTTVKLNLYYDGDIYNNQIDSIVNNVENILAKYHQLTTKYDAYDGVMNVYAINQDPTAVHTIDYRLFDLIQFSLDHQDEVNNLFNIALGPVLKLWHDAREACNAFTNPVCNLPAMVDLEAADQYTDPSEITLDEENLTIQMGANMSIDLGGVSKGYISGKIMDYLDSLEFSGYLLNNGTSNISIGGTHPVRENEKFSLAVTDPTNPYSYYAIVFLGDGDQLVTSGDYQQNFIVDGELYHHIINPNTLMPERYSRAVSIATSDPALADLYSTAIFTMPIEDGLAFVNAIDGLEAIWYTLDNTVVMSDKFEAQYVYDLSVDKD